MSPASEALYFDNAPVAHIVEQQERDRLDRIQRQASSIARAIDRISRSEGPHTAWLRSQAPATAQIRRERLADEARANGGQSNG